VGGLVALQTAASGGVAVFDVGGPPAPARSITWRRLTWHAAKMLAQLCPAARAAPVRQMSS